MLTVGNKVVYPSQGPCLISSIVKTTVDERQITFYQLLVLTDSGGQLLVPVDKAKSIGIRRLLKKPEIPILLEQLKRRSKGSTDRKQRASDNLKLIKSGSAFDLAEIVKSLTRLIETKELSMGERGTLDRAKRLLVCEISEVTGDTREEAEEKVDRALRSRRRSQS